MLRAMVAYLLGPLGRQVLAWYVANSAWVNTIVVLYGVLLVVAQRNLHRIEQRALQTVQAGLKGTAKDAQHVAGFSWQDIIEQSSFFPFVARGNSLLIHRSKSETLEKLMPLAGLLERARKESPAEGTGV
jgi:hypothetical protein